MPNTETKKRKYHSSARERLSVLKQAGIVENEKRGLQVKRQVPIKIRFMDIVFDEGFQYRQVEGQGDDSGNRCIFKVRIQALGRCSGFVDSLAEPKQKNKQKVCDGDGDHDYVKVIGCNGAQNIENPGFGIPGGECL